MHKKVSDVVVRLFIVLLSIQKSSFSREGIVALMRNK